jgi:ribosome-associated toxin RatA of RatAB toxin-antitoxin module
VLGCTQPSRANEQNICGTVTVAAPHTSMWSVLTDFESFTDVMPNLRCTRLPSRAMGVTILELQMFIQTIFWRVEASVNVEVHLTPGRGPRDSIVEFSMFSGDFRAFSGRWLVLPDKSNPQACVLHYDVLLEPASEAQLPSALCMFLLRRTLPHNISALAACAERQALVCPYVHTI